MGGLELAELIKQRRRTRHVPILFLTAHMIDERDMLRGYGTGAVDYLTKPIHADILRSKVAVFVELFRQEPRAGAGQCGAAAGSRGAAARRRTSCAQRQRRPRAARPGTDRSPAARRPAQGRVPRVAGARAAQPARADPIGRGSAAGSDRAGTGGRRARAGRHRAAGRSDDPAHRRPHRRQPDHERQARPAGQPDRPGARSSRSAVETSRPLIEERRHQLTD